MAGLANQMGVGGSSPRARGTLQRGGCQHHPHRFIPACAGNARQSTHSPCRRPVHPRVRGERFATAAGPYLIDGSSPRARGTPPQLARRSAPHRFIPACAGNAYGRRKPVRRQTVHPRVRGERGGTAGVGAADCGSSPRARGTRQLQEHDQVALRFIPACAGNARGSAPSAGRLPVHPRVRGERPRLTSALRQLCGSSPRARGTLRGLERITLQVRFIPACAGNATAPT